MRLEKIDFFRGIAIFLMVLFHLYYSLTFIFNIDFLNFSYLFWFIVWKISALSFIFIAGISFFLAFNKYGKWVNKKYIYYSLKLFFLALLISIVTKVFLPSQFIIFWIIHFFSLAFLLMIFFKKFWYLNIIIGILLIFLWRYDYTFENKYLSFIWFPSIDFISADYYPLVPYFWYMLLWFSFWKIIVDKKKENFFCVYNKNKVWRYFIFMGKHSLFIYLIHQPIIVGIIYMIKKLFWY